MWRGKTLCGASNFATPPAPDQIREELVDHNTHNVRRDLKAKEITQTQFEELTKMPHSSVTALSAQENKSMQACKRGGDLSKSALRVGIEAAATGTGACRPPGPLLQHRCQSLELFLRMATPSHQHVLHGTYHEHASEGSEPASSHRWPGKDRNVHLFKLISREKQQNKTQR